MSKTKKESLKKAENSPQVTADSERQRIQHIINEAQFRFKCCEIAKDFADTQEEMFALANDVYNYSFHVPKDKE